MNREKTFCWLSRIIRLGLGAMFLWTSIPKITAPAIFLASVHQYELVPPALANIVAVVLPWLEFLVGVCLLGGIFVPGALVCCMALCGVFLFAQASVLYRGLDIDCGCGLLSSTGRITYLTLLRSVFLLACSLTGYLTSRQSPKPAATITEPTPQPTPAVAVEGV